MKIILSAFLSVMLPATAQSQGKIDLSGYQENSGAITTKYMGDNIDPYFATKALLLARSDNMEMREQALLWVKWAIVHQRQDGLFERYSRNINTGKWNSYAAADADDAMLAIWLELLYHLAPDSGLPKGWKASAAKAEKQLAKLYDPKKGTYNISLTLPVALLMDNVEIYAAFRQIAADQKRLGKDKEAKLYQAKANALGKNIIKVFKLKDTGEFLASVQTSNGSEFYPTKVAQIFPLLYKLPGHDNAHVYRSWIAANGNEWLNQKTTDYPWGLVAITALDMGDMDSAFCWQNHAEPMRYSQHWNVLEEVALQNVKAQLSTNLYENKIACVGGNLQ